MGDSVGEGVSDGEEEGVDVGEGEDVDEGVVVEVGSCLVSVGVTSVLVGVLEAGGVNVGAE